MTVEQQRAVALAKARLRVKEKAAGQDDFMSAPPPGMELDPETGQMFDPAARAEVQVRYGESPVVGALERTGEAATAAARLASNGLTFGLRDKAAGAIDALTGDAASYDEGVKAQRAKTQALRDGHPIAAGAAELAGGLAGGMGLAANGVTLAGRVGAGILPRMAAFGAEGAAYGAASGAGNTYSDNVGDYLDNAGTGAVTGGIIGAGLPLAGAGVSAAVRGVSAVAGPVIDGAGRTASALLRGAAQADEPGLNALSQMGSEAMLVDAGPSMLGLGQGAGTGTGPGRSELVNALRTRDAGTNQRILQTLNETLGPAPVPSGIRAGLRTSQEDIGAQYNTLPLDNAVDTANLAGSLDAIAMRIRGPAQAAVRKVRGYLNEVRDPNAPPPSGPPQGPQLADTADALFQTRQAIDGLMTGETDPKVIRQLTIARQSVDELLDHSAPGIKAIDGRFQEVARQGEGLTRGGQIFDKGKEAIRPTELAQEIQQGALPAGEMVGPSGVPLRIRQGARAEIDRLVGTNANDLNTLERTLATPNDWNSQKFGAVFGEPERETVAGALRSNRQMRQSYQDIVQGSQTAQRTAAQKSMDGETALPLDTTMTGAAMSGAQGIWRALMGLGREATKDEIGRVLAKQGPDAKRIMEQLLQHAAETSDRSAIARALIANPGNVAAGGQYGGRR